MHWQSSSVDASRVELLAVIVVPALAPLALLRRRPTSPSARHNPALRSQPVSLALPYVRDASLTHQRRNAIMHFWASSCLGAVRCLIKDQEPRPEDRSALSKRVISRASADLRGWLWRRGHRKA